MTFHHPFFYLSYVTVYICFTATFLPPLVTAGTLSRQKILKEKMMQISRSCLLAICVLLLHVTSSFSYNLNSKIMNIATKRLAAAAIVAVGLTGLPDQLFSFSSSSVAVAAAQDVKSIFDGMYSDPNHPGCMRKITNKGKIVTLEGSDNLDGSKPFIIMAKEDFPGTIFVDFSPKGGPPNLLGVFDETTNSIKWPDGNSWKKI